MIKLVGKQGCNRCQMTKNILTNNNIEFEYLLLEDLTEEEQSKYITLAEESNLIELPLIIKENKIVKLQEIINA